MIKHIVLLTWKAGVSQNQIDTVTSAFNDLGKEIAGVVSYSFGQDAGIYRAMPITPLSLSSEMRRT